MAYVNVGCDCPGCGSVLMVPGLVGFVLDRGLGVVGILGMGLGVVGMGLGRGMGRGLKLP